VGISFSFLAREQPRAPAALQRLGSIEPLKPETSTPSLLEWMQRLWDEPGRPFRRYVVQGFPFGLSPEAWALTYWLRGER
jgi:UDP-N-acetyl-D-mannosaminuronic acid transferase (WecB/TagA/CpsF family)